MASINNPTHNTAPRTHEGALASHIAPYAQLRRSVLACLLWEREFYESGEDIASRITSLVSQVTPDQVAALAQEARGPFNLRHVSLWLMAGLARPGTKLPSTYHDDLAATIQRADELTEFLAMYWKAGKRPLAKQVKRGLSQAFAKFDAYQLAKYDRANTVRLRDVMFLTHPKPGTNAQAETWSQLTTDTLPVPNTWETALSAGEDKRETWDRMIDERSLGAFAALRNLRNMDKAGVNKAKIGAYLLTAPGRERILPFRYVAAARAVPAWEDIIEPAMLASFTGPTSPLRGKTKLLIDVSVSMDAPISAKSDLYRINAACALAIIAREICEDVEIWTFSDNLVQVPPRRGFALRDAVVDSQPHRGTRLASALVELNKSAHDRVIVFTDEQALGTLRMFYDRTEPPIPDPTAPHAYMINIASARNGVGYGKWTHIDGFSEAVVRYIQEYETNEAQ